MVQKFELVRTILTLINEHQHLSVTYGRANPDYRKASLVKKKSKGSKCRHDGNIFTISLPYLNLHQLGR